jgi:hypothetical protein
MEFLKPGSRLASILKNNGFLLDQRLETSIAKGQGAISDGLIIRQLLHLNPSSFSLFEPLINSLKNYEYGKYVARINEKLEPNKGTVDHIINVWNHVMIQSGSKKVIGCNQFLQSVVELSLIYKDSIRERPSITDRIFESYSSPSNNLNTVLENLKKLNSDNDFQYLLTIENNRIVFRVASTLGDYVQENHSGIWKPQRAILTHFNQEFGLFTPNQVGELEELINNPKVKEGDLQKFFERYPHFFRIWEYRDIFPQVYLMREDEGPLIPDFILTDKELQSSMIVDIKLPQSKIVLRKNNRNRFSAGITEAKAQLLEYHDWFENPNYRKLLKDKLGINIYRPQLAVIIGRSTEFTDALDRSKLISRDKDIKIVTYDDILIAAKRRRFYIESANNNWA